jgi:hypothetical protein
MNYSFYRMQSLYGEHEERILYPRIGFVIQVFRVNLLGSLNTFLSLLRIHFLCFLFLIEYLQQFSMFFGMSL